MPGGVADPGPDGRDPYINNNQFVLTKVEPGGEEDGGAVGAAPREAAAATSQDPVQVQYTKGGSPPGEKVEYCLPREDPSIKYNVNIKSTSTRTETVNLNTHTVQDNKKLPETVKTLTPKPFTSIKTPKSQIHTAKSPFSSKFQKVPPNLKNAPANNIKNYFKSKQKSPAISSPISANNSNIKTHTDLNNSSTVLEHSTVDETVKTVALANQLSANNQISRGHTFEQGMKRQRPGINSKVQQGSPGDPGGGEVTVGPGLVVVGAHEATTTADQVQVQVHGQLSNKLAEGASRTLRTKPIIENILTESDNTAGTGNPSPVDKKKSSNEILLTGRAMTSLKAKINNSNTGSTSTRKLGKSMKAKTKLNLSFSSQGQRGQENSILGYLRQIRGSQGNGPVEGKTQDPLE